MQKRIRAGVLAIAVAFALAPEPALSQNYTVKDFLKEISTSENKLILNTINMTMERVNIKLISEKKDPLFCTPKDYFINIEESADVIKKFVGNTESLLNGRWQTITVYLMLGLESKYPCKK